MKNHFQTIDSFAYQSSLRKCSALFKFLLTVTILILCLLLNDVVVSFYIIVTMLLCNVYCNGVTLKQYAHLLFIPFLFLFFACAAIAVEITYYENISIVVTQQSFFKSICIMTRAFAAVSTLYFLTLSTPIQEMVSILKKFHLPSVLIELMYMIYRYIFILSEVQYQLKMAAISRMGYCDFVTSCKTFGHCVGNLFIISLKKAEIYYQAMESRCYDGEFAFLEEEKHCARSDIVKGIIYLLSIVAIKIVLRGY